MGFDCETDWINIPCATNHNNPKNSTFQNGDPNICVDRICGMVFNSVRTSLGSSSMIVYSFTKPFILRVHTDSTEGTAPQPESNNRGFCLNFMQKPCIRK